MAANSINVYAPASPNQYPYTIGVNFTEEITTELEANNKSKISAKATFYGKNIRFSGTGGTLAVYWFDNNKYQNGVLVASQTISTTANGVTYAASGTIEVEHDIDGKLQGYAKTIWTKTANNSYVPPSTNVDTGWQNLTSIARATKINDVVATIGKETNISWTKANPNFTHTLSYTFGDVTEIIGENLVDNFLWTPNAKLYQYLPTKSGEGILTLTTYNGEVKIGNDRTAKLTLLANEEEVKAEIIEKKAFDTNEITKSLTGDDSILVIYKSTPIVEMIFKTKEYSTATKLVINGLELPLHNYELLEDGKTTQYTFMTGYGETMTNNFNIEITDSRGFVTKDIIINEFVNYIPLSATSTFKRTAPTTGEVAVNFNGIYFNKSFGKEENELYISYAYKKNNEEEYSTPISLTKDVDFRIINNKFISGNGEEPSFVNLIPNFDYRYVYNIQLYVSDKVSTLPPITATVAKGISVFWWNEDSLTVNGDVFLADKEGNNPKPIPKIENEFIESEVDGYSANYINNLIKPSFAQMWTNGSGEFSTQEKVDFWAGGTIIEEGDFVCEPEYGRILIPAGSAKRVEMFAHCAGGDYALIDLRLTNGSRVSQNRAIIQSDGNRYWSQPVANMIVEIADTTKDSYLEMYVGGYNATFLMNTGFGNQSSFMGVRKLS